MPFEKGKSGNPSGRQTGHRVTINKAFLRDLARDFQLHGKSTIEKVRQDDPAKYLSIVSALQPKESHHTGKVEHDHSVHHDGSVSVSSTDDLVAGVIEAGKNKSPKKPVSH